MNKGEKDTKDNTKDNKYKYIVKVKSKVFPGLHHNVEVDLYCYEKIGKVEKPKSKSEK